MTQSHLYKTLENTNQSSAPEDGLGVRDVAGNRFMLKCFRADGCVVGQVLA